MNLNSTPDKLSTNSEEKLNVSKTQRDRQLLKDAIQRCHNRREYDRSLSVEQLEQLGVELLECQEQLLALEGS